MKHFINDGRIDIEWLVSNVSAFLYFLYTTFILDVFVFIIVKVCIKISLPSTMLSNYIHPIIVLLTSYRSLQFEVSFVYLMKNQIGGTNFYRNMNNFSLLS